MSSQSLIVRESASYRYTQHRRARGARQGGISVEFFSCFLFCVAVGCLPREGFQILVLQTVRGRPFRLAASRVRESRCREPALVSAGPDISVAAFGRRILPETVMHAVICVIGGLGTVSAFLFI